MIGRTSSAGSTGLREFGEGCRHPASPVPDMDLQGLIPVWLKATKAVWKQVLSWDALAEGSSTPVVDAQTPLVTISQVWTGLTLECYSL